MTGVSRPVPHNRNHQAARQRRPQRSVEAVTAAPAPRTGAARPAACPAPSPGPGAWPRADRRSASPGDKIRGSVRGTRTSGAVRDRRDPPCRRVSRPRGTGLTCTGVSPGRRDRHTGPTRTTGGGRSSARQPRLPVRQPHHRPVSPLIGQEIEHVRCCDLDRSFPITVKNVFRLKATARSVFGRHGLLRTPDTGPPADRPAGNGPGQTPTRNAQDTGSCSFQHHPSM